MMMDDTGGFNDGDEEGEDAAPGGYRMGAPASSTDGKSTKGDATNTIESHSLTDKWWCATSPEG